MKNPWKLPEGWRQQEMLTGQIVLSHPEGGHVTVDLVRRGFKLGWGSQVPARRATNDYVGLGWRGQLFNDAIAALNEIYKEEK